MTTRNHLHEGLEGLRRDLAAMGARVEEAIAKARTSLRDQDVELARAVKAADAAVDELRLAIEDKAAVLLATQQPVARDLRELVALFKAADCLERAGDYAVRLAKSAIRLAGEPPFRQAERLDRMAGLGAEMARGAVAAFLAGDAEAARRVAAADAAVDAERKLLVAEVLALMRDKPELAEPATRLIRTSDFLERLGDHMVNLCEAVVYLAEGRREDLGN